MYLLVSKQFLFIYFICHTIITKNIGKEEKLTNDQMKIASVKEAVAILHYCSSQVTCYCCFMWSIFGH